MGLNPFFVLYNNNFKKLEIKLQMSLGSLGVGWVCVTCRHRRLHMKKGCLGKDVEKYKLLLGPILLV